MKDGEWWMVMLFWFVLIITTTQTWSLTAIVFISNNSNNFFLIWFFFHGLKIILKKNPFFFHRLNREKWTTDRDKFYALSHSILSNLLFPDYTASKPFLSSWMILLFSYINSFLLIAIFAIPSCLQIDSTKRKQNYHSRCIFVELFLLNWNSNYGNVEESSATSTQNLYLYLANFLILSFLLSDSCY